MQHIQTLIEDGCAYIDPIDPEGLIALTEAAMDSWKWFCELPFEIKTLFTLDRYLTNPDNGYISRLTGVNPGSGKQGDPKQYFHYRPDEWTSMLREIEKHNIQDAETALKLRTWFDQCFMLYEQSESMYFDTLFGICEELGIWLPKAQIKKESRMLSSLRFLCYESVHEGAVLAKDHPDRSLFTMHHAETKPGMSFEVNGKRVPFESKHNRPFMFPGEKAACLFPASTPLMSSINHGVTQLDDSPDKRYAIVSFWHLNVDVPKKKN